MDFIKPKDAMEREISFLPVSSVNDLLLKVIYDLKYISEDELSDLFCILRPMLKGSKRLFHPFYDEEEATIRLLRKGWLIQVGFSPVSYALSPSAPDENAIQKGFAEACDRSREAIQEFLKHVSARDYRGTYLKRIALAATAYDKVPEHLQMDFLMKSGIDETVAKEAIQIFKKYMVEIKGLTFPGYR